MAWFFRRSRRADPPPTPQLDASVSERLAAAGKDPTRVQATPAELLERPARPGLPGFTGLVSLELTLDAEGRVRDIRLEGGPAGAATELEAWARAWRFRPAQLEGRAHPCRMVFQVNWD